MSIILERPFLSTTSAIVDIRESKPTLQVGEELVTFGVDKAMKHSKYSDETTLSVDILEDLIEEWKEDKSSESPMALGNDFDAERDQKELERLLEELKHEELIRTYERSTRRVDETN